MVADLVDQVNTLTVDNRTLAAEVLLLKGVLSKLVEVRDET